MAKKKVTTANEPDSSEIVAVSFHWTTYFGRILKSGISEARTPHKR